MEQLVRIPEIIAPDERVDVYFRRTPLRQEREHIEVPAGLSIEEIIACCGLQPLRLHVSIAGHVIEKRNWARVRVKPGFSVVIVKVPGKGALRAIAGLVVAIIAGVVALPLAGVLFGAGTAAASIATGVIGAGISMGDCLAFGMLFLDPIREAKVLFASGGGNRGPEFERASQTSFTKTSIKYARHYAAWDRSLPPSGAALDTTSLAGKL